MNGVDLENLKKVEHVCSEFVSVARDGTPRPLEGYLCCADCAQCAVSVGDWHLHSNEGVWREEGGASCCSVVEVWQGLQGQA